MKKYNVPQAIRKIAVELNHLRKNIAGMKDAAVMSGIKINKAQDYLYQIDYDTLNYKAANKYFDGRAVPVTGACSAIRSGNYVGRTYDWLDSYAATFTIRTSAAQGRYATIGNAAMSALTVQKVEGRVPAEEYARLPFYLLDGINSMGLFAEMNVVPKTNFVKTVPAVEKQDRVCDIMLVRYILDHYDTVDHAIASLQNYAEIFHNKALNDLGYEVHIMLADATKTAVVEFINNEIVAVESNISTNCHLHGVEFNGDGSVYTVADLPDHKPSDNKIETYGSGLERLNILNAGSVSDKDDMIDLMKSVYFSQAYTLESDMWYSEYVGGDITVDTPATDEKMVARIADLKQQWEGRTKDDPKVWITAHMAVYDLVYKTMTVAVQEGDTLSEFSIGLQTENKSSLMDAINELTKRVEALEG